ncbi:hypothetical protein RB195_010275 [Necator americanus]|uniref:Uncharacterized protein n=1 Tax=Necator americanus TaxID=51031 RepID=A0ABR1CYM1_NECAM
MATTESHRETADVDLFDSVDYGGVFSNVGRRDWGFSSKSVSPLAKRANQHLTVLMVVVPSPNPLFMLRAAAVAPMPPRHS